MFGSVPTKVKSVSWIIGPDGESKSVDVNSSGGWAETDDDQTRPVLQLSVTDTQPGAQPVAAAATTAATTAYSTHPTLTPSSCKPMQLRPRSRVREERERMLRQEEKGGAGAGSGTRMAWSYDKIMECCGRF